MEINKIPKINIGDLIYLQSGIKAIIERIYDQIFNDRDKKILNINPGDIEIIYREAGDKYIKTDATWNGSCWEFKHKGPSGSYVNGAKYYLLK